MGWRRIVAFQTRNPLHRAHQELTFRAAREAQANLLIHPVVGMTKPGDVDHFTAVRCYEAVLDKYPSATTHLSLLNLAMRMAGPREALWHAIIRRTTGLTHFIVGRDHAGPGKNSQGKDFYDPYAAQELVREHQAEVGIEMVDFKQMVYVRRRPSTSPWTRCRGLDGPRHLGHRAAPPPARRAGDPRLVLLPRGGEAARRTSPERPSRASRCSSRLLGLGQIHDRQRAHGQADGDGRPPVTLLDGDVVRKHLSSELGFSKEHRDINIKRIGYVASEITKNGGIAICAPIAPYAATPPRGARDDRGLRRLHRGACRDLDRGMRAARPQGALQARPRRQDQGVHRHLRPL
jgi:sulfate adenylyltransferase